MRTWICLSLVCLAASVAGQSVEEDPYAQWNRVKVGDLVPAFTYRTLAGVELSTDQLKGKVLFINFFATWCGPCRVEMPHLEALFKNTKHKDFLMVSIGREHSAEELATFKREQKLTVPMAPDPERKIYGLFAEQYIPRNVVVGRDGRIKWFTVGYQEEAFAQMCSLINGELAQPIENTNAQ